MSRRVFTAHSCTQGGLDAEALCVYQEGRSTAVTRFVNFVLCENQTPSKMWVQAFPTPMDSQYFILLHNNTQSTDTRHELLMHIVGTRYCAYYSKEEALPSNAVPLARDSAVMKYAVQQLSNHSHACESTSIGWTRLHNKYSNIAKQNNTADISRGDWFQYTGHYFVT